MKGVLPNMKKIPTLFKRTFDSNKVKFVYNEITPGCEAALGPESIPTLKIDGACCAIIDGIFYKRYDAKNNKPIPKNAIKCQETADPITGHLPCWVPCNIDDPSDKWFISAYNNTSIRSDGTYEAIGPHFRNNAYSLDKDILVPHGKITVPLLTKTFDGIKSFLEKKYETGNGIEGIVFWLDGKPLCKIKSSDFGIPWQEKPAKITP